MWPKSLISMPFFANRAIFASVPVPHEGQLGPSLFGSEEDAPASLIQVGKTVCHCKLYSGVTFLSIPPTEPVVATLASLVPLQPLIVVATLLALLLLRLLGVLRNGAPFQGSEVNVAGVEGVKGVGPWSSSEGREEVVDVGGNAWDGVACATACMLP